MEKIIWKSLDVLAILSRGDKQCYVLWLDWEQFYALSSAGSVILRPVLSIEKESAEKETSIKSSIEWFYLHNNKNRSEWEKKLREAIVSILSWKKPSLNGIGSSLNKRDIYKIICEYYDRVRYTVENSKWFMIAWVDKDENGGVRWRVELWFEESKDGSWNRKVWDNLSDPW